VSRLEGLRALAEKLRDPVVILPYLGYGTPRRLRLSGRVLQDEGLRPAADTDRRLRNLVAFLKRMESDEVPGARLRARHARSVAYATSDREGYFHVELDARARPGWNEVELQLVRKPGIRAVGRVLVPPREAHFGVVSDIDDTIVESHVLSKWRMLLEAALSNARTRKPLPGVGAFYRALHRGVNPVFYVSKSPWNLYAPLVEYLEAQALPLGPLALRDFGLRMSRNHKSEAIEAILSTYPRLSFVLIGDSGERDPELYAALVRRHPRRIRALYIRSADRRRERLKALERLDAEAARTGCRLVLAQDAEQAAAHAAAEGLIAPRDLADVRRDAAADSRGSGAA
jgi:phosphatidate phosphatase APP1